jgi:protein phosphatase
VWSVRNNQSVTPGRRYGHVMAYMRPWLVVFGGNTGSEPVNDVWVLDIMAMGAWASVPTGVDIPSPRVYHAAAVCRTKTGSANGMLVVFGGRTSAQSALNDTWGLRKHKDGRLDWVRAPIKQGCEPPSPRYQHSLLFLGTLMLVVGGRNNQVG